MRLPGKSSGYEGIKLGRRVSGGADGYEEVGNLDLAHRPTLLTFCGAQTTNSKDANGFAKLTQQLIGRTDVYDSELQIIGTQYMFVPGELYAGLMDHNKKALARERGNYMPHIKDFVREHFACVIADDEGKRLPLEVAKKNMRNVNMMAYSYGGAVISEIGNYLCEVMRQMDYSRDEIKQITKQACAVTVGNCAEFGCSEASFTAIHVMNTADTMIVYRSSNIYRASVLADKHGKKGERLAVIPVEGTNETLVLASPINSMPRVIKPEDKGSFVDSDKNLREIAEDPEGHMTYTYMAYGLGEHGLMIPNLIAIALTNAVNNSIKNASSNEKEVLEIGGNELLAIPRQMNFRRGSRENLGVYSSPERIADNIGFEERIAIARAQNSHSIRDRP